MDLCTLQDVRDLMSTPASDTRRDAWIERLIPRVSEMIAKRVRREFVPGGLLALQEEGPREVLLGGDYGIILTRLAGWDIRKGEDITVEEIGSPGGDVVRVLGFRPSGREDEPVYHSLYARCLPGWSGVLRITATWGWPEVPGDVVEACAGAISHHVTQFPAAGRTDPMSPQPMWEPRALPKTSYDLLLPYAIGDV